MAEFSVGDTAQFEKKVQATGTVIAVEPRVVTIRDSDGADHRIVKNFAKKV